MLIRHKPETKSCTIIQNFWRNSSARDFDRCHDKMWSKWESVNAPEMEKNSQKKSVTQY